MERPDKEKTKYLAECMADAQYDGYEDGYHDYIAGVIDGINFVFDELERGENLINVKET